MNFLLLYLLNIKKIKLEVYQNYKRNRVISSERLNKNHDLARTYRSTGKFYTSCIRYSLRFLLFITLENESLKQIYLSVIYVNI